MMKKVTTVVAGILLGAMLSTGSATRPGYIESPPTGIHPSDFATGYQGCLGPLRSRIARGEFAGVRPFGRHFTGDVNPGRHQGTVGEEEFLREVLGIENINAFCSQYE